MLLKLLKNIGVKEVSCAGFDGYSDKEDNYFDPSMEYGFVKSEAKYLNKHMKNVISDVRKEMSISFLTYSAYEESEDVHDAAF